MGGVPHSREFTLAQLTIELWRAVLTKKRGAQYSMNKIRRMKKQLKLSNLLRTTMEEAKEKEKAAWKNYYLVKI